MMRDVTEIGSSNTVNISDLCMTYLTTVLSVSAFLTTESRGKEKTGISIILHER